jgi:hypothetical protein
MIPFCHRNKSILAPVTDLAVFVRSPSYSARRADNDSGASTPTIAAAMILADRTNQTNQPESCVALWFDSRAEQHS